MARQNPAVQPATPSGWPSRDRQSDPVPIGQRVRLLRDSRAKLLWDRTSYSALVAAGAEGVVTGYELLDRDGYLTTDAIQELRGYPGTPAYEVASIVTRPGHLADTQEEAWAYVTADDLAAVDVRGWHVHPHDAEVERRLRAIEREACASDYARELDLPTTVLARTPRTGRRAR